MAAALSPAEDQAGACDTGEVKEFAAIGVRKYTGDVSKNAGARPGCRKTTQARSSVG